MEKNEDWCRSNILSHIPTTTAYALICLPADLVSNEEQIRGTFSLESGGGREKKKQKKIERNSKSGYEEKTGDAVATLGRWRRSRGRTSAATATATVAAAAAATVFAYSKQGSQNWDPAIKTVCSSGSSSSCCCCFSC